MEQDQELEEKWEKLREELAGQFGKKPDLNGVLFLVGIRELGAGTRKFTKEQKVDLMHIAVCRLLSDSGYYRLAGKDKDGWPHWEQLKKLPFINVIQQENYLKFHIIEYFEHL